MPFFFKIELETFYRRETDAGKSTQIIFFEKHKKGWSGLEPADTMLPEAAVFPDGENDRPALGREDLFIPTHMVEILYAVNTLIRGRRRLEVQDSFMKSDDTLTTLNRIIDAAAWNESDSHYVRISKQTTQRVTSTLFYFYLF